MYFFFFIFVAFQEFSSHIYNWLIHIYTTKQIQKQALTVDVSVPKWTHDFLGK